MSAIGSMNFTACVAITHPTTKVLVDMSIIVLQGIIHHHTPANDFSCICH